METKIKPNFREEGNLMVLDDIGLQFNAQSVGFNAQSAGPRNFLELRQADYGPGFRMPTIPELVPLVYASLENQDYDAAKNVVNLMEDYWLTGNTGIRYVQEGMFVQDNPKWKGERIYMSQKVLESRLGSHEEEGVVFSDDGSVRFTPYGFVREEEQSSQALSVNPGVIALVGGEENAEKLARASEHYKHGCWFHALSCVELPEIISVAGLFSYGFNRPRLGLDANVFVSYVDRFSFGVLKDAEGIDSKK